MNADMAELADAYGLGPYTVRCGGSSPSIRICYCFENTNF